MDFGIAMHGDRSAQNDFQLQVVGSSSGGHQTHSIWTQNRREPMFGRDGIRIHVEVL